MTKKPCGCGGSTYTSQQWADMIGEASQQILAKCVNCNEPLVTINGLRQPVHRVQVVVSGEDVKNWQAQGYEFQTTPLKV